MTTDEAIAMAQKIQATENVYDIAKMLLHIDSQAELRGIRKMAAGAQKIFEASA